jgi:hypothetical protein
MVEQGGVEFEIQFIREKVNTPTYDKSLYDLSEVVI